MSNAATTEALLQHVAEELFSTYGLNAGPPTRPGPAEALEVSLASIIGFTGPVARGTLMLALPRAALESSKPPAVDDRDWLAELGNQLLGRLKNQLARYGVDITMTTPLVIRGERLSPTMRDDQPPYRWALPGGTAYAWFDATFEPDFVMTESANAEPVVAEGESMLF